MLRFITHAPDCELWIITHYHVLEPTICSRLQCKPYTHLSWSVSIAVHTLGNSFKCPTPSANASSVDHSKLLPSVHTVILTSHKWCVYTTNKYTIRYYEHYSTNTTGSQVSYGIISQTISSSSVFQKLKFHKTEGWVTNLVSEGHCHKKYVEIFYCNSWVSHCFFV